MNYYGLMPLGDIVLAQVVNVFKSYGLLTFMLIFIINSFLVALIVLIHYEMLRILSVSIPSLSIGYRLRVLCGVLGALTAHVMEVWVFGFGYYFVQAYTDLGGFSGMHNGSLLDSVYFSFSAYTSLGFGDIAPTGGIRFTAGLEALVGLVLIAWSASFLYLEMTQYWKEDKR